MRSKELGTLKKKLAEHNTHYSHLLFVCHQFSVDNEALISKNGSRYTDEIYPENSHATQFKVKASEFSKEFNRTTAFFRKSIFLLGYFQFEVYVRELYNFGKQYKAGIPEINPKVSAITQVVNNFNLPDALPKEELNSLEYFRLRRNATVHRLTGTAYRGEYADFIKENGKSLDKYWKEHDLYINGFSFRNKDLAAENFTDEEVFDCLNMIRRIAENLDNFFMEKVVGVDAVLALVQGNFSSAYNGGSGVERDLPKFCHLCLIEYGLRISVQQAKEYLGV